jgi:L-fuconolactonase
VQIIDAHHHLWERGRFGYGWLKELPAIDRDFLIQDYEETVKGYGIAKSVFVQADVDPEFGIQETRWALSLAESDGPLTAVVAWAPVEKPVLEKYLEDLGSHPRLKGVRRLIQGEPDPQFCARPDFVEGVRKLARSGLSFDLCVYHHQLPAVIELVRQVPEVSFVLDHIGKPDIARRTMAPWQDHIRELARLENVVCKVSGMATEADWKRWRAADLRPYLEHAIAVFGFDRLMFGSDWPVSTLAVEYGRWLAVVQEAVKDASSEEQHQLFYGTAARFYRL